MRQLNNNLQIIEQLSQENNTINRNQWLRNYNITENRIPIIRNFQETTTLDQAGIDNINNSQQIREYSQDLLNISNSTETQLYILDAFNDESISLFQNFINNHPMVNRFIVSNFINSENREELLINLRDALNQYLQNRNINTLIIPFFNSFYIFLQSQYGRDEIVLLEFNQVLRDIYELFELVSNQQNLELIFSNTENQILQNLRQFNNRIENLYDNFDSNLNNNNRYFTNTLIQEVFNIINNSNETQIEINNLSIEQQEEIEKVKNQIIEKLNKIFNKKLLFYILFGIAATYCTNPTIISGIISFFTNSQNFISSNEFIQSSQLINTERPVLFRDIIDEFMKKLLEKLKNI